MRYPNAFAGVKKIFTAEILSIISAVAVLVAALFGFTSVGAAVDGSATGAFASLGGAAIFTLGAGIVAIIAFILNIVGINSAAKDEPTFKKALIAVLVGIIASVLSSVLSSQKTISSILSRASGCASVIVTIFVIMGIQALAKNLGNEEMIKKGNTTIKLVLCSYLISTVLGLIADIAQGPAGLTVTLVILAIVSAVFSIIEYVFYLRYLSAAKMMLMQ